MSFSSDTKAELAHLPLKSKIEALLELSALARLTGSLEGQTFIFSSENPDVGHRLLDLIAYLYGEEELLRASEAEALTGQTLFQVHFSGPAMRDFLYAAFLRKEGEDFPRAMARLETESNAKAYLRGAFLAAGSLVNPKKSYHMEISCPGGRNEDLLRQAFMTLALPIKSMERGHNQVFYLKDSEEIANFLVDIGANSAMLQLEDAKAMKNLRDKINRQVNAETANVTRTVNAGLDQLADLDIIEAHMGIDHLPDSLREAARMRIAYPQASLAELGELMHPPISKSGMRHRMKKIEALAAECLAEEKDDEKRR